MTTTRTCAVLARLTLPPVCPLRLVAQPPAQACIFGPVGPPLHLAPTIETTTGLPPVRFLRPPGRIISGPFDTGTIS